MMVSTGGCQFGKLKLSVNLATAHPVNVAIFFVRAVNVANSPEWFLGIKNFWVGVGEKHRIFSQLTVFHMI